MERRVRGWSMWMLLCVASACGSDEDDGDLPGDGAGADASAGPADAASALFDAGPTDAGPTDAAPTDGGPPDAAAELDAAPGDAGLFTPACADDIDQDGDGLAGYPQDPGCASVDDDDESDGCPDGVGCPRCANGSDDDDDGLDDFPADIGCASAADDDESDECVPGLDARPLVGYVRDLTEPGPSLFTATCDPATASAPEDVWAFRLEEPLELMAFGYEARYEGRPPSALFNPVLTLRYADCGSSDGELACGFEPDFLEPFADKLMVADPLPGTYYVFVDSASAEAGGYGLYLRGTLPAGARCVGQSYESRCSPNEECDYFGDGFCHPVACSDGIDNDGDGLIDWPEDTGCGEPSWINETLSCDGGGTACFGCSNGLDDDDDGLIDWPDDPDCASAQFPESAICLQESDGLIEVTGPSIVGTTVGATSDFNLEMDRACDDDDEDFGAPDRVHALVVPGRTTITVTDNGSFPNRNVGLASGCEYIYTCMRAWESDAAYFIDFGPGILYIVVDGDDGQSGTYDLVISGEISPGQPCDPAQIASGMFRCGKLSECIAGVCRY